MRRLLLIGCIAIALALVSSQGQPPSVCADDAASIPGDAAVGPGKVLTKEEADAVCSAYKTELMTKYGPVLSSKAVGCKKGLLIPENGNATVLNNDLLGRFFVPGYVVVVDSFGDCQMYHDEC
jgi:hypothetical protein